MSLTMPLHFTDKWHLISEKNYTPECKIVRGRITRLLALYE